MPFCHFSRVYKGTSLADLKAKEQLQISRKCKEVEYEELISILVDQEEFDFICNDLSTGNFQIAEEGSYDLGKLKKRHGGILQITEEELIRLKQNF